MLRSLLRLLAARSALAGIEFALILPVMLTMLAGLVDISLAVITARRLTVAAADVALVASTMAVQSSSLNALNGQQAWQATTAPFAIFPAWRDLNGPHGFSITLSAVDFTGTPAGCTTNCAGYIAATRWSVANRLGQIKLRPCGALAAVPDGQSASMATLPTGIFLGPVPMLRSAYVPPRVNNGVQLSSPGPGSTVSCPQQGVNGND